MKLKDDFGVYKFLLYIPWIRRYYLRTIIKSLSLEKFRFQSLSMPVACKVEIVQELIDRNYIKTSEEYISVLNEL